MPSTAWNCSVCMIRLIWSVSFLSMAAIIASMVLTTSLEMTFTPASACSASVLTADSTSF